MSKWFLSALLWSTSSQPQKPAISSPPAPLLLLLVLLTTASSFTPSPTTIAQNSSFFLAFTFRSQHHSPNPFFIALTFSLFLFFSTQILLCCLCLACKQPGLMLEISNYNNQIAKTLSTLRLPQNEPFWFDPHDLTSCVTLRGFAYALHILQKNRKVTPMFFFFCLYFLQSQAGVRWIYLLICKHMLVIQAVEFLWPPWACLVFYSVTVIVQLYL